MDMEYDDILQTLCDVWEKVKEVMRKFAERLRELFSEAYLKSLSLESL